MLVYCEWGRAGQGLHMSVHLLLYIVGVGYVTHISLFLSLLINSSFNLQDDLNSQLVALQILNESLTKYPSAFIEQFSRLGLAVHLSNLAGTPEASEDTEGEKEKPLEAEDPETIPDRVLNKEETDGGGAVATEDSKQEKVASLFILCVCNMYMYM